MIAVLLLIFTLLTGIKLVFFLNLKTKPIETLFVAGFLGPVAFTIICYLFSLIAPFILAILLSIFIFSFLLFFKLKLLEIYLLKIYKSFKKNTNFYNLNKKNSNKKKKIFLAFLIPLIFLSWFYPQILLKEKNNDLYVKRNAYGDTQFHAAVIASFAYGENFPAKNPLFKNISLSYPFLTDLFSAINLCLGASWQEALAVPTVFFSLLIMGLMFILSKNIGGKNFAAVLSFLLFFLNGGLGFIYFFKDSKNQGFLYLLQNISKEYTHLPEKNIRITNTTTGFLPPERALLFGLPGFLLILILLYKQRKQVKINRHLLLAALVFGLFPFIHGHGFLVLIGLCSFYSFFDSLHSFKNKNSRWKKWLVFWFITLALSLPQFLSVFSQIEKVSRFIKFQWGWLKNKNESFFWFWFKNIGILGPLIIISLLSSIKKSVKFFYLPFLLLFLTANLFIFQPFDWDNVKFFIFFLLGSSILVGLFLEKLIKKGSVYKNSSKKTVCKKMFYKFVTFILIFFLVLSGIISLIGELQWEAVVFSKKDQELADFVRFNTKPSKIFLSGQQANNPAACLSGRQVIMGYEGYLWTQGINYQKRAGDVYNLFTSKSKFLKLNSFYNINYIIISPEEKQKYKNRLNWITDSFPKIFDNSLYQIYQVN